MLIQGGNTIKKTKRMIIQKVRTVGTSGWRSKGDAI